MAPSFLRGHHDEMQPADQASRPRPEVLAPAGDPLSFRAALAAGADAIYLGMARFNARGRADRFKGVSLAASIRAAHGRGVRVYVTLNTLIHDDELPQALDLAGEALESGADAAIVQDLGFAALLREKLPALALHASTQMTLHQGEQAAEAVKRLGLRRVIAPRECSAGEIARLAERLRPLGAGVEVFVHGALCFAYSGQCLMSNFAGRRSANRGICAQNCRFDYSAGPVSPAPVLPEFRPREATQLISMKDLAAFGSVAALVNSGVDSFKIEGRLKGPDYVYEVVRLYRAAIDAWEAKKPFAAEEARRAAGRVYSRGFTDGYLSDRIDPTMRGDKRRLEGEPDAVVRAANRKTATLVIEPRAGHQVRAGQGYRYAHDRYRGGFRVIGVGGPVAGSGPVGPAQLEIRIRFGSEASGRRYRRGARGRLRPPPPLPVGLALYLNDDPDLEKRIEAIVGGVEIDTRSPEVELRLQVRGGAGEPLHAKATAADGRSVEAVSDVAIEPARARALDGPTLEEHLGRLGGTIYRLEALDSSALAPGSFLPFPALHQVRRLLVEKLDAIRIAPEPKSRARPELFLPAAEPRVVHTKLTVTVGSPEAFAAAVKVGAGRVIVEDPALLAGLSAREVDWKSALGVVERPWFRLPPLVHAESQDQRNLEWLLENFPRSGVLAGHLGQVALAARAGFLAAADLYLNCYNHLTARLIHEAGATRIALSLEVDAKEAVRVASRVDPGIEIEVVVGGSVFSMLTRQPYGLEEGEKFLAVSEHGHAYRFEAAGGGITTLYEARELVGAGALAALAGRVDSVRLDLAHHEPHAVEEITVAYRAALDALSAAADSAAPSPEAAAAIERAQEVHRRHAPAGAFEGHLFRGARALDAHGEG
jgi:U32 family peptidase